MSDLSNLLKQNREWAARMERERPGFFGMLRSQQRPRYLSIGCSDSRVPANEIVDLPRARYSSTATWRTWWCTAT